MLPTMKYSTTPPTHGRMSNQQQHNMKNHPEDQPSATSSVAQPVSDQIPLMQEPQMNSRAIFNQNSINTHTITPRDTQYLPTESHQPLNMESHAVTTMHRLLNKYRQMMRQELGTPKPFVSTQQWLHDDQVFPAIMAVTEAIRKKGVDNYPEPFFDASDANRVQYAKHPGLNLPARSVRPRRPLLLPWFYDPQEQKTLCEHETGERELERTGRKRTNDGAIKNNQGMDDQDKDDQNKNDNDEKNWGLAHIFLVLVRLDEKDTCSMSIYDSAPAARPRRDPILWQQVTTTMQRALDNLEWKTGDYGRNVWPRPVEGPITCEPIDFHVAKQNKGWECGHHTILNAWSLAMNLDINPDVPLSSRLYRLACEVINLVVAGYANANLIYSFLVGTGWAKSTRERKRCPSFGLLRVIHSIRDHDSLTRHLYEQEMKDATVESFRLSQTSDRADMMVHPEDQRAAPADYLFQNQQGESQLFFDGDYNYGSVSPAVMGEKSFANQDCISIWRDIIRKRPQVAQPGTGIRESKNNFARYYLKHAKPESGASELPTKEMWAAFTRAKKEIREALDYPVEETTEPTESRTWFMRLQVTFMRQMSQHVPLSAEQRRELLLVHERVKQEELERQMSSAEISQTKEKEPEKRRDGDGMDYEYAK